MRWIVDLEEEFNGYRQFVFEPDNPQLSAGASGLNETNTGDHVDVPHGMQWSEVADFLKDSYPRCTVRLVPGTKKKGKLMGLVASGEV